MTIFLWWHSGIFLLSHVDMKESDTWSETTRWRSSPIKRTSSLSFIFWNLISLIYSRYIGQLRRRCNLCVFFYNEVVRGEGPGSLVTWIGSWPGCYTRSSLSASRSTTPWKSNQWSPATVRSPPWKKVRFDWPVRQSLFFDWISVLILIG